jgi:hypothetical protein
VAGAVFSVPSELAIVWPQFSPAWSRITGKIVRAWGVAG